MNARDRKIARLYRSMPGSPEVPFSHAFGEYLWGEVENNEYWQFCADIVDLIEESKDEP